MNEQVYDGYRPERWGKLRKLIYAVKGRGVKSSADGSQVEARYGFSCVECVCVCVCVCVSLGLYVINR